MTRRGRGGREDDLATIYDVAKQAGVSPKTVSRVLNGDAPVNERTRAAVEAAIEQMAYVPSNAARTMRSRRSGLVGLVTGAISTSPGGEPAGLPDINIVQGAQSFLADNGLTVLISDTGGKAERVPELVRTLVEHRVEGLIYVAEYHQQISLPGRITGRPIVLANCFDTEGTPAVVPDDAGGQHALVSGLIERGHRRIGFLTLPEIRVARGLRLDGYKKALREAGIAFDPKLVISAALSDPAHEFDLLWDALDRLLNIADRPTAICCGNDKMAMRVYALLRERGLSIPEDISVAGYDDYRIICEHVHPTMTSVDLPYEAMGARAASTLLKLIRGETRPEAVGTKVVAGPVAWRQSIAASRGDVISLRSTRRNET